MHASLSLLYMAPVAVQYEGIASWERSLGKARPHDDLKGSKGLATDRAATAESSSDIEPFRRQINGFIHPSKKIPLLDIFFYFIFCFFSQCFCFRMHNR